MVLDPKSVTVSVNDVIRIQEEGGQNQSFSSWFYPSVLAFSVRRGIANA
jgi:hypothetical protein